MSVVSVGKLQAVIWGVFVCMGLAGCSGSDASAGAASAGTSNSSSGGSSNHENGAAGARDASGGAGATTGSGATSYPGCEHVIISSTDLYTSDGSTPNALAAWKGQLYLLSGDGKFQTVRVTNGAALEELARVPDDDDRIDLTPTTLSVDDQGIFFDGYQDGHKRLIGVPFAGGDGVRIADITGSSEPLGATFVSDANAIYFAADEDGGPVLKRTPRTVAKASAPVVLTDYTAFYNGLVALGRIGTSVFTVSGGAEEFVAREFPVLPDDPPSHSRLAEFKLKDCRSFAIAPRVVSGDDALYVGCNSDGNEQSYIFRLPPSAQWPEDEETTVSLEPVASGRHVDEDTFIVVGQNVYFHDVDAADDDHVYRVPTTGGTPTRVLDTHAVSHMASDGKTLFVEGSCGIQAISL